MRMPPPSAPWPSHAINRPGFRRAAPPATPALRSHSPKPTLGEFVILSMLLHALAILLFGAPSGASREGRAMWGSMQLVIRDSFRDVEPKLRIDRALPSLSRPLERRTTREDSPRRKREAAKSAPQPAPVEQPIVVPRLLDRLSTPTEPIPPMKVPPPTQAEQPAPPEKVPVPEERPAAPIEKMAPIEVPLPQSVLPAPIPVVPDASVIERVPVPKIEPPPVEAPLPVVPVPLPSQLAPLETPALPTVPAPPRIERPPVPAPPVPAQAQPVPPQAQPLPPQVQPAPAPRSEPAVKPVEKAPQPPVPAATERVETPVKAAPAPAAPAVSPFRSPAPSERSVATPRKDYDPTAPAIDLDAVRRRAADLARQGTGNRAVMPFPMPPIPDRKTKMETAIENARKPDCRTAYKDLGLAAVVPLIANEFGEGTCRW